MREWQAVGDAGGLPLPQFNAYPLQYITSSGEYLMMLPQQLEALVGGEDDTDSDTRDNQEGELAGLWLDKVSTMSWLLHPLLHHDCLV